MSLNYVQGIIQKEETSADDDLTDSSEEKISQSKVCFHHYFSQLFIGLHIRYHNESKEYYVLFTRKKRVISNRSSQGTKSTEEKMFQAKVTLALIPL